MVSRDILLLDPDSMQSGESHSRRRWARVAILVLVGLISRLPQLASPHLLLDGDACILGLMAKHVAEGRAFPIFFYGQNYGLAVVEAPAGALSFLIGGVGALQLELAMLALWMVGVLFYFRAASRLLGCSRGFWIALVLVLHPAWAVTSMSPWSGYITAFAASAVLLDLVIRFWDRPQAVMWLATGILTAVIYLAQPLWLPGLAPVLAFQLFRHRTLLSGVLYSAAAATLIVGVRTIAAGSVSDYWTRPEIGNRDLLGSLPALFDQIYLNLTGSYYLWFTIVPGRFTAIVASVWCAVLIAAMLLQMYRLVSRRYVLWSHLLCVSVLSTILANWVLFDARDGRYFLPLSALLVLWAGIEISDLADRNAWPRLLRRAAVGCMVAMGALSMIEFRNYSHTGRPATGELSEAKRMERAIRYMQMKGARHAFSMNPLFQWQLMFYSSEGIIARWTSEVDRYPPYVTEVDRALRDGETVALVGNVDATRGLENIVSNPGALFTVDDTYFVYVGPDKALLERLGFRFRADGGR